MRDRVAQEHYTPVPEIYRHEMASVAANPELIAHLPSFQHVKTALYKIRKKTLPPPTLTPGPGFIGSEGARKFGNGTNSAIPYSRMEFDFTNDDRKLCEKDAIQVIEIISNMRNGSGCNLSNTKSETVVDLQQLILALQLCKNLRHRLEVL